MIDSNCKIRTSIDIVLQILLLSARQCPKYCVNEKTGFRYFFLHLDSCFQI